MNGPESFKSTQPFSGGHEAEPLQSKVVEANEPTLRIGERSLLEAFDGNHVNIRAVQAALDEAMKGVDASPEVLREKRKKILLDRILLVDEKLVEARKTLKQAAGIMKNDIEAQAQEDIDKRTKQLTRMVEDII